MTKNIASILPNPDDLLALEPEELAGFVIEHFNTLPANEQLSIHPDNFVNLNASPVNRYPREYQGQIAKALMEAWEWLVRAGLFARQPGSPGWYFITRRGERMKTASDLQSYRLGEQTKMKDELNPRPSTVIKKDGPLLSLRYKIIRLLANSGFAQTHLGEDILLPSKRKCIIKQFAFSAADPKTYQAMLERFELEAITLEKVAKHNDQVPDLYAYFPENGKYYLVQEYIEGDTVAAKVAREGTFSDSRVREILGSLLVVLKSVHAHSLIHRDIKPENIVLRESDNKPFLIDFGAIKELARTVVDPFGNPSTTIAIGTPGYWPTEQVLGRPVFASDLYCLGLTAIFMLTGKRPQELNDLRTGEIVWRDNATEVSSTLTEILDKAIRSNFKERFPEATDMLNALNMIGTAVLRETERSLELAPSSRGPLPSDVGDANMPQVATWWLKDFLGPVIEVVNYIRKHFNENLFTLTAHSLQDYGQVFEYRIDFFQRQKWDDLLSSDLGEYFLNKHPLIKDDLATFQDHMDSFDDSFVTLLKDIENSSEFLKQMINTYETLIQHERIPRSQYSDVDLDDIAALLLGQLHLQISNFRMESKDELVRFTGFALLGLNVEFPINSIPEDRNISGFCRDAFRGLQDRDLTVEQSLQESKNLFEKAKTQATELWQKLRQYRIEIASRYNATFQ